MGKKRLLCILSVLIYALSFIQGVSGLQINLQFSWAFIIRDNRGNIVSLDDKREIRVDTDTGFKFAVLPQAHSFIYIYHISPDKKLTVLYPENNHSLNNQELNTGLFFIPAEQENWFFISGAPGTEELYFLASGTRLTKLETLAGKYAMLYEKDTLPENQKLQAAQDVLNEILSLIKNAAKMTVYYERPVPIAGALRSGDIAVMMNMKEVNCEEFYYERIRLYH